MIWKTHWKNIKPTIQPLNLYLFLIPSICRNWNHLLHFMRYVKHFWDQNKSRNVSRETLHKRQHHLFTSGGSLMLRIGCHLSSSKGYCAMAKDALKIHANTFQYFSRNPRGGNAKSSGSRMISPAFSFRQKLMISIHSWHMLPIP